MTGWLDKQIAKVAPGIAVKRALNRKKLDFISKNLGKRNSVFDAINGGRLRYDFLSTDKGPNAAISDGISALRNHVRQLEYNNGMISGPIRRLANNVVGRGIRFQARVTADDGIDSPFPRITEQIADRFNLQAERAFKVWARQADMRLMRNFYQLQRLVAMALPRDGEILAVIRESGRNDRIIPYCVELLEADRLDTPTEERSNPAVRSGVRYDAEGVPEAYFILKQHPGEDIRGRLPLRRSQDFDEIPAFNPNGTRKVLHIFDPIRAEQDRGFSEFAPALKAMQDMDRYWEAEMFAALEAACLTGVVKSSDPVGWQQGVTEASGSDSYDRIHEFAPGKWHYLNPGEEVSFFNPSRPNQAFGDIIDQMQRNPANALDMPPEVLSQNWHGMNYSNARTVLLSFYLSCRIRQQALIDDFCIPILENVIRAFVVKGIVQAPGFDRRMEDYMAHAWIPPGWDWVDPVKEANGKKIDTENNTDSYYNVAAARGQDGDEILEANARWYKRIRELEAKYGIKFPQSAVNSVVSDPDADPDDEDRAILSAIQGGKK